MDKYARDLQKYIIRKYGLIVPIISITIFLATIDEDDTVSMPLDEMAGAFMEEYEIIA